MRILLSLVTLLVFSGLAFLRNRREHGIVEIALRQQLATYAQQRSKPRLTPLDRVSTKPQRRGSRAWVSSSFPGDSASRYLIFENDSIFSGEISRSIRSLGITPKRTAYRSSWQNGTVEQ